MKVITKDPEVHAIELLNTILEQTPGWSMTFFAFSRLLEHYRSEYQIKIAVNLLNDVLGDRDGVIYICEDATIMVCAKSLTKAQIDKMIFQLRYLFLDDPLAYNAEGDENPDFYTHYSLDDDWEAANETIKRRLVARMRKAHLPKGAQASQMEAITPKTAKPRENAALNATSLARIEKELPDIDLLSSLRRQPVCAALPGAPIRSIFDELYINIAHLKQALNTEIDLLSNRWLFKYLTQKLDYKMLQMLSADVMQFIPSPISLNLNIPTLLSQQFSDFDASLKPGSQISVVLELQIADVFADMSGFLSAKDAVQKLGYRVCLDGVTDLSFPQIDRLRLGFDLIKLQWNADGESDATSQMNKRLAEAIRICGVNRVILSRCDNEKAVEYGKALGLSLFQGRYLDQLINPKSTVQN